MRFDEFVKENRKRIIILSCLLVILEVLLIVEENLSSPYIFHSGKVVAIDYRKVKGKSVPINVKAVKGSASVEKSTVLNLGDKNKKSGKRKEKSNVKKSNEDAEIARYNISKTTKEIEHEDFDKNIIALPDKLEDGTTLSWKKSVNGSKYILPFLLPVLVYYMYRGKLDKIKKEKEMKKISVVCELPSFNNQLILLLDTGLVLTDAMDRIIDGYNRANNKDFFQSLMVQIGANSKSKNVSVFAEMQLQASNLGIRDFSRLANILMENQYRGIDIKESLTEEAEVLWNNRRRNAEELGKKAEIKLAFPMALYLIVLIAITALPAMMNVKGGLL